MWTPKAEMTGYSAQSPTSTSAREATSASGPGSRTALNAGEQELQRELRGPRPASRISEGRPLGKVQLEWDRQHRDSQHSIFVSAVSRHRAYCDLAVAPRSRIQTDGPLVEIVQLNTVRDDA